MLFSATNRLFVPRMINHANVSVTQKIALKQFPYPVCVKKNKIKSVRGFFLIVGAYTSYMGPSYNSFYLAVLFPDPFDRAAVTLYGL